MILDLSGLQVSYCDQGEITFAVIGDYGRDNPDAAAVAELVASWEPDFVITLGDNNYPAGAANTIDENIGQFYHRFIHPYKGDYGPGAPENRFFPSLGNHDWARVRARPYLDWFELPGNERYYDVSCGPVHLVALDSDPHEPDGITADSKQARWAEDRMIDSDTPFQIVFFHHPPYSSGSHGSTVEMRWPFAEWGADAVLAGHEHLYERIEADGIVYLVAGTGGARVYAFESEIVYGSRVRIDAVYGALKITVNPRIMRIEFVDTLGFTLDSREIPVKP